MSNTRVPKLRLTTQRLRRRSLLPELLEGARLRTWGTRDLALYVSMLRACLSTRRFREVLEIYREIQSDGIEITSRLAWSSFLQAALGEKD